MKDTPEFASFNRFSDLQARSLLYYQAELTLLKQELIEHEWEDYRRGDGDASKFFTRADYLVESANEENNKQWVTMEKIRKVLKSYSEHSLQPNRASI